MTTNKKLNASPPKRKYYYKTIVTKRAGIGIMTDTQGHGTEQRSQKLIHVHKMR